MTLNPKPAGLYIHFPFCVTKCPYCDFYSITDYYLQNAWLNAVKKEILSYKKIFNSFNSIFIGGGTPSSINEPVLVNLFDFLNKKLHISSDSEITIECNPEDLSKNKLNSFTNCGINRISLGAQSFLEKDLVFLCRRHNVEQVIKSLVLIQENGKFKLNVDIMSGFQGQSRKQHLNNLEKAVFYKPEHISCYQLTVKQGTPFYKLKKENKLSIQNEKTESETLIDTHDFLQDNNYLHYEVSNYANSKDSECIHNLKYWKYKPYLGIGPSAHSFFNNKRWWNFSSVSHYINCFNTDESVVDDYEMLNNDQQRLEKIYLGLRLFDGFDKNVLDLKNKSKVLDKLKQDGYLKIKSNNIVPTIKGMIVADSLAIELT